MSLWLLLVIGGLVLAVMAHTYALAVSRRARSAAATTAFWCGIVGFLSIPVAIVLMMAAVPFFVTGPPGWLDRSITISWSVMAVLPVISFGSAVVAMRNRNRPN